jgi:hypothetical protein
VRFNLYHMSATGYWLKLTVVVPHRSLSSNSRFDCATNEELPVEIWDFPDFPDNPTSNTNASTLSSPPQMPLFPYPLGTPLTYRTSSRSRDPFSQIHVQLTYNPIDLPTNPTHILVKLGIMKLHEIRSLSLRIVAVQNEVPATAPKKWEAKAQGKGKGKEKKSTISVNTKNVRTTKGV